MARLQGQNLRVHIGSMFIGEATNCTITLTNNTDEATDKDVVGNASRPVVVTKSWQVQAEGFDVASIGTFLTAVKSGQAMDVSWDETEPNTAQNRTVTSGSVPARHGLAFVTDVTLTANDREFSTDSITFTGTGPLSAASS